MESAHEAPPGEGEGDSWRYGAERSVYAFARAVPGNFGRSPETLESRLNLGILKSFRAHKIEFPNRQSDVYIRKMVGFQPSSPESIET